MPRSLLALALLVPAFVASMVFGSLALPGPPALFLFGCSAASPLWAHLLVAMFVCSLAFLGPPACCEPALPALMPLFGVSSRGRGDPRGVLSLFAGAARARFNLTHASEVHQAMIANLFQGKRG